MCLCVYAQSVYRGRVLYRVKKEKHCVRDSGPQKTVFHACFLSVLLVALLLKTRSLTLCSGAFHSFLLFHSCISFSCFYRLICNSVMFFEQQQQKRHLKMLRFFFQEIQMFNNPLGSVMSWREKKEDKQTGEGEEGKDSRPR